MANVNKVKRKKIQPGIVYRINAFEEEDGRLVFGVKDGLQKIQDFYPDHFETFKESVVSYKSSGEHIYRLGPWYFVLVHTLDPASGKEIKSFLKSISNDTIIAKCVECGNYYLIRKSEKQWFQSKGYRLPVRCKRCRLERKNKKEKEQQ